MDLILWRHAEAEDGSPSLTDTKRRLTPRGEKQARDMAKWLRTRLPKKTRILVSPAMRTQQTVHTLMLPFEIEPRIALGASVADHLAVANWPRDPRAVLLVGHQPALGDLAAFLMTGQPLGWSVKKGGIWWFSCRNRDGADQVVLRAVVNPDLL